MILKTEDTVKITLLSSGVILIVAFHLPSGEWYRPDKVFDNRWTYEDV